MTPVPYVTAYDGEDVAYQLTLAPSAEATDGVRLSYTDAVPTDYMFGALWHRHGLSRLGRPQFKLVNTARQRRCMLRLLCQVCGRSARDASGLIPWLMTEPPSRSAAGDLFTHVPPTCQACIPVAALLCPQLKKQAYIYTVSGAEPFGVVADVFKPAGRGLALLHEAVEFTLDAFHDLEYALAKQLIVSLVDLQDTEMVRAA